MKQRDRPDDELQDERPKVKVTDRRTSARRADAASREDAVAEAASGDSPPTSHARRGDQSRGSGGKEPASAEPAAGDELEKARAEAAEYLDHLRRLKAEFDNYRKRVLKEQTRSVELATEPLMSKLLEVLDEFELAIMAADAKPDFERFLKGVEMVYGKLLEILRSEGLERIDAEGDPFDPEVHEALLQAEGDAEGEAYVADVLRTGYRLKGRLLRPAGVKVARS